MGRRRNYAKTQLHAGKWPKKDKSEGNSVFHTDTAGLWWSGYHITGLTAAELLQLCRSTEADLLRAFSDL